MGFLIVLDGVGGMEKSTQQDLLIDRLSEEYGGDQIQRMRFPRHSTSPYGPIIRAYLDGAFGDPDNVSPYFAGMLYAQDRASAMPSLREMLDTGKIVVVDQYVGSSLAYQGTKCKNTLDFCSYTNWQQQTEYTFLKNVREDLMIILHAPVQPIETSTYQHKPLTSNTKVPKDKHELDSGYVQSIIGNYLQLANLIKYWQAVNCASEEDQSLRSRDEISDDVWRIVQTALLEWKTSSVL